ncbi:hypothetical protein KQI84_08115 [bacterium]|nr:hypothetical protein [bacterium]
MISEVRRRLATNPLWMFSCPTDEVDEYPFLSDREVEALGSRWAKSECRRLVIFSLEHLLEHSELLLKSMAEGELTREAFCAITIIIGESKPIGSPRLMECTNFDGMIRSWLRPQPPQSAEGRWVEEVLRAESREDRIAIMEYTISSGNERVCLVHRSMMMHHRISDPHKQGTEGWV